MKKLTKTLIMSLLLSALALPSLAETDETYNIAIKTANNAFALKAQKNTAEQETTIEITNMVGLVVFKAKVSEIEDEIAIDLKPGYYIVRMGNKTTRIKVN